MRRLMLATVLAVLAMLPDLARAQTIPEDFAQLHFSFAPLVRATGPAVVNVYARTTVSSRGSSPFANDPFFRRFFGADAFGAPRERVKNALGSGVIVDPSGLVVTNNHVVKNATDIRVVLPDRREFDATLLLADERTDLAVLRVDNKGRDLPVIALGDSDGLEVGDLVLAIGNPFGVGQTVTSGIVSALARTEVGISDYQFFIQTDAAINPGNSGGALIDMSGRLVGINTAIYSRSGGSIGIGFAIPSNMVSVIIRSAAEGGRVVRPWLGAELQNVTAEIADSLGLARPRGVLIVQVEAAGPLGKAALRQGDLVLAVDRHEVNSSSELLFRTATKGVGGKVELKYLRNGEERLARISLIAAPETVPRESTVLPETTPLGGLVVANLSPAVADELGMSSDSAGVVVTEVRDGPGARFGFRKGDIIVSVNGVEVDSVATLAEVLGRETGSWNLAVNRKGRTLSLRFRG